MSEMKHSGDVMINQTFIYVFLYLLNIYSAVVFIVITVARTAAVIANTRKNVFIC